MERDRYGVCDQQLNTGSTVDDSRILGCSPKMVALAISAATNIYLSCTV
jgi:hypothetical protein